MTRGRTQASDGSAPRRIIVAGYGPVGRVAAERLEAAGAAVMVIEMNPRTVDAVTSPARPMICGDARDPAILRQAGIDTADALIIAIPDENEALEACRTARKLAPSLFIAARTNFLSKGLLAREAGADHVVVEEVVTAEAMGRAVMDHLLQMNCEGAPAARSR